MSVSSVTPAAAQVAGAGVAVPRGGYGRRSRYLLFALPALLLILAVIVFPWAFTVYMSLHDWGIVGEHSFAGLGNYTALASDARFLESICTPSISPCWPCSCL